MTPAHIKVLGVLALVIPLVWVMGSRMQQGAALNRLSGHALVLLSLIALVTVVSGIFLTGEHQGYEGAAAHIFQQVVVAVALVGTLFLSTAKRSQGLRSVRPLAIPAVVMVLAFGTLYCFEHFR